MNKYQTLGSAITYLRRYSLSAMLGIVSEEDNDAAGEPVKTEKKEGKKEYMSISHKDFNKAKEALGAGKTSIEKIQEHYELSQTALHQLQLITNNSENQSA